MKDCPKCNKQIPDEAIFCAYCGCNIEQEEKSKAKFCIKCGTPFNDGMMFCMKCGNKLVEDKQDDPWAEVDAQKQDDPWADFADYKEKPSQVAIAQDLYQKGSRLFDEGMESEDSNKLKEAELSKELPVFIMYMCLMKACMNVRRKESFVKTAKSP